MPWIWNWYNRYRHSDRNTDYNTNPGYGRFPPANSDTNGDAVPVSNINALSDAQPNSGCNTSPDAHCNSCKPQRRKCGQPIRF